MGRFQNHVLMQLLLLLILCGGQVAAAGAAVTRDDAIDITTETLLGGTTEGVRLFLYPEPLAAGTVVATWTHDVFGCPAEGWLLFIDPSPGANWEHPCQYVFVTTAGGQLTAYDASTPPNLLPQLEEITDGFDNPPPGASEKRRAWFLNRLATVPKPMSANRGQAHAFIISGGANMSNNHIRYWNDCAFIYTTLTQYYEYPDENIRVCISDGLNPAPDRSDGSNSPPDLDGDNDDDIEYPATREYIAQVFGELAESLAPSDQLFIFTTDHGGTNGGWDAYLNLWNSEVLQDWELAEFVDALPCETIIGTFEQCYSGGMIDNLEAEGRVLSSAARYDQLSWAMPPNYIYDEYVYYWTCAVAWEDPYGNPVNADLNNDQVISMWEAFVYAEEHDTAAEDPQYSSTPPELGEVLNLMGNLEGVYLTLDGLTIDDDMEGASHGDGDGIVEFGEAIELSVFLHNIGMQNATDVTGQLTINSAYVGAGNGPLFFGDIPADGTVCCSEPMVFYVSHRVPDGEILEFTLDLSEDPGSIGIDLTAHAPTYLVGIAEIDDTVGGNGNGIPDPGEVVELTLQIDNLGSSDSPDLTATLGTASAYFGPDATPHALGVLPSGGGITEVGFSVTIAHACPPIFTHYLRLVMEGPEHYVAALPFVFSVGEIFADDMELGAASWVHYAGPGGSWIDEWHLESYRNHTPTGASSWKCGGAGAASYGNLLYAILESAEFDLPPGSILNFWHWMDAEVSQSFPDHCYDGGLLEISADGGTSWDPLTPADGYPYLIRAGGTPGPFVAETPVWSGQHGWTEVSVDLSAFAGPVKLRWAFGSDGAVAAEGWYLDDVHVMTLPPSGLGDQPATITRPVLFAARPNPAPAVGDGLGATAMTLRFALPDAAHAELMLFDAGGRLVRVLAAGRHTAGEHHAVWDGRDTDGLPVGSGSYYCRLAVDGREQTQKLTVLR